MTPKELKAAIAQANADAKNADEKLALATQTLSSHRAAYSRAERSYAKAREAADLAYRRVADLTNAMR